MIDKAKRASEFKELLASCPKYGLNESYFETDGQNSSLFDRDCEKITIYFFSKWHQGRAESNMSKLSLMRSGIKLFHEGDHHWWTH